MFIKSPKLLPRSLTALAAGVLLQVLSATSLHAATITNDVFAKDTSGNNIYAQGGGVFKFGSKWYWYGVKYNGAVTYAANPVAKNSDTSFNSFTCYSSTDLVNWVNEGPAMTTSSSGMSGTTWIGRMGVVYHAATAKYILVSQYQGPNGYGVMFATSSTPNGDFTWHHLQTTLPTSTGATGDQTVFIDTNGAAYLVCSNNNGRANLYVLPFRSSDYLNIEAGTKIATTPGREGNCMMKVGSAYYFMSSLLYGWNSSPCYVQQSTSIQGTYSAEYVMNRSALDYCHVTQTGFGVGLTGSSANLGIFVGDRWSDFAGNGVGYNQWCPVTFSGTTPTFQSVSKWDLNAAAGTWSVVKGNNYILNPSYEADRVAQTAIAGWTHGSTSTSGACHNVSGGQAVGNFAAQHSLSTAYQASTYQNVTGPGGSALPTGTYTLSFYYKTSGGQSSSYVWVKNHGGTEIRSNLSTVSSSYTKVTIPNINITTGVVQVGFWSSANAGNWVNVDDWSLTQD